MIKAIYEIFCKTSEGKWKKDFSDSWYRYYDSDGYFILAVGQTCHETYPCQHYITFQEDGQQKKLMFMSEIQNYLDKNKIPIHNFHS